MSPAEIFLKEKELSPDNTSQRRKGGKGGGPPDKVSEGTTALAVGQEKQPHEGHDSEGFQLAPRQEELGR